MDQNPSKRALSRRELLKVLTAAGGAVAASSLLPKKWSKPQVGLGALPAHAQATTIYTLACDIYDVRLANTYGCYQGTFVLRGRATISPPDPNVPVFLSFVAMVQNQTVINYQATLLTDSLGQVWTPLPGYSITLAPGNSVETDAAVGASTCQYRCQVGGTPTIKQGRRS
jgi:hypothetical protein